MNWRRPVIYVLWVVISIIVMISFALSYTNLVKMAIDAGWSAELAPLWPLCVDLFMVLASIYILLKSLDGEVSYVGWAALAAYTLLSVYFNVAHSPGDLFSIISHATPPLTLCFSLEFGMLLIKVVIGDAPLMSTETDPLSICEPVKPSKPRPRKETPSIPPEPEPEIPAPPEPVIQATVTSTYSQSETRERVLEFFQTNPTASIARAQAALDLSWATVDKYKKQLSKDGLL